MNYALDYAHHETLYWLCVIWKVKLVSMHNHLLRFLFVLWITFHSMCSRLMGVRSFSCWQGCGLDTSPKTCMQYTFILKGTLSPHTYPNILTASKQTSSDLFLLFFYVSTKWIKLSLHIAISPDPGIHRGFERPCKVVCHGFQSQTCDAADTEHNWSQLAQACLYSCLW